MQEVQTLQKNVIDLLHTHNALGIELFLNEIHPADLAHILTRLGLNDRQELLRYMDEILPKESLATVLTELPPTALNEIIEYIFACATHKRLEDVITSLESDDLVSLLEDLKGDYQSTIIEALPKSQKKRIEASFTYPEDSAGRMMQQEFVTFHTHDTLNTVRQSLKHNRIASFYDLYIVDEHKKVVGFVTAGELLKHDHQDMTMEELMHEPMLISPLLDQEDVIHLFKKYGLMSAPVVEDTTEHMLGVITADDVISIMDEEADEDVRFLGGVLKEATPDISIIRSSYYRIQWLMVTFCNTLIASSVLYQFQYILSQYVALAILMPIVASMGGNVGMQVVTLMVRFLATRAHEVRQPRYWWRTLWRKLFKEIRISSIIGLLFATLIALITALWFHDARLGCILGAAMLFNTLWAGCAGTFLPLFIHRLGFDPAISSGPFLTTLTDVTGFSVFLGLAQIFLRH